MQKLLMESELPKWFAYPDSFKRIYKQGLLDFDPWIIQGNITIFILALTSTGTKNLTFGISKKIKRTLSYLRINEHWHYLEMYMELGINLWHGVFDEKD